MSADAAAQAATHENPEPRDPFFPFTDVDPSTFTNETFKTFQSKVNETPENVRLWFQWIAKTVKYKNHLVNKIIGQQEYLNSILKHEKDLTKNYTAVNKKCTELMMYLADTKKELVAIRRELAQTRLELADEQSKNIENIIESSSSAALATPVNTTSTQSVMSEKKQRSAKLPDALEYKGDRDFLKPWIM